MADDCIYDPQNDTEFTEPFLDTDEIRTTSGIPFRYFHGGFRNTALKFSFCFPAKPEEFEGRFFQYLSPFPGPDEETASLGQKGTDDKVAFAVRHGAAFVESNMASTRTFGNSADITQKYRSSACTAQYCREIAREKTGWQGHVYGYVFGGSGGAYKTFSCIEQTRTWEGAVPMVPGCPAALPNVIFVRAHALRLLRHRMDDILDAVRAGSLHGLKDSMNEEEKEAFDEVTAMGYPPEAWLHYIEMGDGSLQVLVPGVKRTDPDYFTDFWEKEGYLGAVKGGSAERDRICVHTTVKEICLNSDEDEFQEAQKAGLAASTHSDGENGVASAWKKKLSMTGPGHPYLSVEADLGPDPYDAGLLVTVESGACDGQTLTAAVIYHGRLYIGPGFMSANAEDVLPKLRPGDHVFLDNSDYIALQTYHRHQVPDREYQVWDQFRNPDGSPKYPQRASLLCYGFAQSGAGSLQNGRPQGKVICLSSLADDSAFPWMADWYAQKVRENQKEKTQACFRLWYNEHSFHGYLDPHWIDVVNYQPQMYQALLDVAAWAEKGIEPAQTSAYEVTNGQVRILPDGSSRGGLQPSIHLLADGAKRAEVKRGEDVLLRAECAVPKGTGRFVSAQLSLDGDPGYPVPCEVRVGEPGESGSDEAGSIVYIREDGRHAVITAHCSFDEPGDHFVWARICAQRDGRTDDIYTTVMNISAARIAVGKESHD